MMGARVKKGILKPLRYFSQMFDTNKEPEMQIGMPTDVKHVAHIGWDNANINTSASWMKDFHSAPLSSTGLEQKQTPTESLWGSQDFSRMEPPMSPALSCSSLDNISEASNENALAVVPSKPRHGRRHQAKSNDSGNGESTAESSRRSRRAHKKDASVATADVSSTQDLPAIPKQSHRRRSKQGSGSGSGGSTKSSTRNKAAAGTTNEDDNQNTFLPKLNSVAEKNDEEYH